METNRQLGSYSVARKLPNPTNYIYVNYYSTSHKICQAKYYAMKIRDITENLSLAYRDPKTGKRRGPTATTLMSKPDGWRQAEEKKENCGLKKN